MGFDEDRNVMQWEDEGNILVYDNTEWVSWLSTDRYLQRISKYWGLNFGGTADWAVDLEWNFGKDGLSYADTADDNFGFSKPICDYAREFRSLDELEAATEVSAYCREIYALGVLQVMLDDSHNKYNDENNGYDSKFKSYVRYMDKMVDPALDAFMVDKSGLPGEGMKCKYMAVSYHQTALAGIPKNGNKTFISWQISTVSQRELAATPRPRRARSSRTRI